MKIISIKKTVFYFSLLTILVATGCSKDKEEVLTPALTTLVPTDIAHSSATVGGNITADGGAGITAMGVVWGTNPNPDLNDSFMASENNVLGIFNLTLTGLDMNTTYYVRAYATNSQGTEYGNEVSFKTLVLSSYFNYEGNSYELDKGFIEYYGQINENPATYNLDLVLVSPDINFSDEEPSGIGHVLYFQMFSSSMTDLVPGTYSYDVLATYNANTFDFGLTYIDINLDTGSGGQQMEIEGGTVKIEKSGQTYEITIDCTLDNGKKVTGYYKNSLIFIADPGKSTKALKIN